MRLTLVNSLLLVGIIVVNTYIIVTPFLVPLFFTWERHGNTFAELSSQIHKAAPNPYGQRNWLIIPVMLLSQPINEGKNLSAASRSPWRLPYTSTPDKGGNTVIIGHRFTYANPRGAFYQLDKVKINDEIGIYWNAKRYRYKVVKIEIVSPSRTSVEAPTSTAQLTLYTCTPLWWPKNRLVVVANLESSL